MVILGIGGILKEAASAVVKHGELAAAVEQLKIARRERPGDLPEESISACLELAKVHPQEVDCVALVRPLPARPQTSLHLALRARFPNAQMVVVEHHTAHAASAYYASPFTEAVVLTLDRAGDFRCGARWSASGNQVRLEREMYFPESIGDLYGRVTELLGYESQSEEHKIQWLSTSGDCRYLALFKDILAAGGGWPRLDRSYFHVDRIGRGGFSARFYERLGLPDGATIPLGLQAAIAASLQRAVEETVIEMAGSGENLCLAGGVANNSLLVAALENSGRWRNVFAQPVAGNAGTAVGATLFAWHNVYQQAERVPLGDLCLGPTFTPDQIKKVLENCKLRFRYLLTTEELIETAIREIHENKTVAWMHGRMEFGPRALGNRSILASPLDPYSTENLNVYIKHREPFRKFAASVPAEDAAEFFEVGPNARFLATVGRVRPAYRKTFESAIMGDSLIRVHTVRGQDNPLYWRLLKRTGEYTRVPVLYNTSFNLFGDPMVCTPRDAVRSFYSSGIDSMFVGNFLLQK